MIISNCNEKKKIKYITVINNAILEGEIINIANKTKRILLLVYIIKYFSMNVFKKFFKAIH